MSKAVHEILERIQHLPAADRLELEGVLTKQMEAEWQRVASDARRLASQMDVDQATIDRAVEKVPNGS